MLHTTRAVVLRTIKHGDRTVVLKAYTELFGLRSYMVRSGGKGGVAPSALLPLSRVELVVTENTEREMHTVRELRVERPYTQLHVDAIRGTLALFTQELLYKVLREESEDPDLFAFVEEALEAMDTAPDVRCFPLVMLVHLSGHLGFYPEPPRQGEDRFDLKEGHFIKSAAQLSGPGAEPGGHTLGPPLSALLAQLLQVNFRSMATITIPSMQRRELLERLLLYCRLHVTGLGEMRSPAVLHQVLG